MSDDALWDQVHLTSIQVRESIRRGGQLRDDIILILSLYGINLASLTGYLYDSCDFTSWVPPSSRLDRLHVPGFFPSFGRNPRLTVLLAASRWVPASV